MTPNETGASLRRPPTSVRGRRKTLAAAAAAATFVSVGLVLTAASSAGAATVTDQLLAARDQNSGARSITSPAFSTSDPEVLVAFLGSDGPSWGAQRFSSVTGCGLTWRLAARANSQPGTAEAWTATATTPVSSCRVTGTRATGYYQGSLSVVGFTNAAGVGAYSVASAASGAPTVSLTPTQTGSVVYGQGDDWDNAVARTVGTNQTKVHELLSSSGDTFWLQKANSPTTAGEQVTVNDTAPIADRYNLVAVEVTPMTTASPAPSPSPTSASPSPTSSPVSGAQAVGLWPSTAVPGTADASDASAVELGARFYSDVPGTVTGVRFYKSSNNTGTHTGSLWDSSGNRLATATFSGESGSGWQQVTFSTPVHVNANQGYVASYHTNAGHYADDQGYFTAQLDRAPLHAYSGNNGVYVYGSGGFPTSTWNTSNYWVDVTFVPDGTTSSSPSPSPAPTQTSSSPSPTPTQTSSSPSPTPTQTSSSPSPSPSPTQSATSTGTGSGGIFAANSIWNAPLAANAPLASNSAALATALNNQFHYSTTSSPVAGYYDPPWNTVLDTGSYSIPIWTVPANQPTLKVVYTDYSTGQAVDPNGTWNPCLQCVWNAVPVPTDVAQLSPGGTDGSVAIYQPSTDTYWEFWQLRAVKNSAGQITNFTSSWGGRIDHASQSNGVFPNTWGLSASSLAYGGAQIRIKDFLNGSINHALSVALPVTATNHVAPATRNDYGSATPSGDMRDAIPEGTHFRLPANFDINSIPLANDTSDRGRLFRMILIAARDYGFYVSDRTGGTLGFSIEPNFDTGSKYSDVQSSQVPSMWGAQGTFWGSGNLLQSFPWNAVQVVAP